MSQMVYLVWEVVVDLLPLVDKCVHLRLEKIKKEFGKVNMGWYSTF